MRKGGFSLVEALVAVIILGILVGVAIPHFGVAAERARMDRCTSTLHSIWNAQRMYWLQYRTYSNSLDELISLQLLDKPVALAEDPFSFEISNADATTFVATAVRKEGTTWSRNLQIDQDGALTGKVVDGGGRDVGP